MNEIKAIDTVYNGYRFRSRLEARWAVFFDELGIKYEYEKEGFELPSGRYLPDFWLPEQKLWIEIKPPQTEPIMKALNLCLELHELSKDRVALFCGNVPSNSKETEYMKVRRLANYQMDFPSIYAWLNTEYENQDWNDNRADWLECPICHKYLLTYHGFQEELDCCIEEIKGFMSNPEEIWLNHFLLSWHKLDKAYLKARQARFEFAEGVK